MTEAKVNSNALKSEIREAIINNKVLIDLKIR